MSTNISFDGELATDVIAALESRVVAIESKSTMPTAPSLTVNSSLTPFSLSQVLTGSIYTSPVDFLATAIVINIVQQGSSEIKLALYEKINSSLLNKLSESVARNNVPIGNQLFDLITPISIQSVKTYFVAVYAPFGNNYAFGVEAIQTDAGLLDGNSFDYDTGFPNPLQFPAYYDEKIALTLAGSEDVKLAVLELRDGVVPAIIDRLEALEAS